ncbi:MAG: endonuclease MutS2 [Ignavibacteriaceae bacterium]|nr:endonuclease MutS2 [Ignavibacteriaceae bacterium]
MIDQQAIEKLEFKKIIDHIAGYASTEKGKKSIINIQPLKNKIAVLEEGKLVSEAKEILIKNEQPPLEYIPDLTNSLEQSKIDGAVLSAQKILEILKFAKVSRSLRHFLKQNLEIAPSLKNILENLFSEKIFEHHIEKIIDDNGDIKDKASSKLFELRKEAREKQVSLTKAINRLMKSLENKEMVREDYLTLRDGRMVIPVKAEHKRHLKGFIHSESSTGQTVYIEPEETLELNNEIVSLGFAEKREIERLLKEITQLIGKESTDLFSSLKSLTYLDSLFARAKYSIEVVGSFPSIDNTKPFFITDARHPVLLKKMGRQNTVPLGFKLNNENVVLITGPNAGGKTVVLKTIGILSLLMQSGIHIPVSPDSNFHFFENILVDIGDEQSIEDDLSTFSSHLTNIKNILIETGNNSLVLLDEIGTGTDPSEGSALAAAILLELRDKNALVFASTHHGNLKLIANDEPGFINAAMEFDHKKLVPAYKFKLGVPGSSYAFEIARRIGIDEKLIENALQVIDTDKHKIEQFLVDLESKSSELQTKLKELEIENSRLAGLSNLYKNNIERLEKEKKDILKKTKIDADDFLSGINRRIENVIKEIKESNAKREVIKEAKKIVESVKEESKKIYTPAVDRKIKISDFNIGSFVNIKNTATTGTIVQMDKEKKSATVESGAIRMVVKLDELEIAETQIQEEKVEHYHNFKISSPEFRLDIRGKKPEEADFSVVRFVDDSFMSGQSRIEILHGKGTGALKKMVKEILDQHERVKNYYFAPIESGGDGITIVELN